MTLTHGGLFEGYGGTTMAARAVLGALDTRWVSDIKPASVALLRHHHPDVPNLGDMTGIDYRDVEPVDVLTASWPCQPHSSAGKRLGKADPRALWPYVARAISQARPAVFLGENVARIATNGELRRVVGSLAALGYVGAWRCFRACDIGAPHRRDRCFVVAVDPAAYADQERRQGAWSSDGGTAGRLRTEWGTARPAGGDRDLGLTLLPTPTANLGDHKRGSPSAETGRKRLAQGRRMLEDAVAAHLLPTPRAGDAIRGGGDADAIARAMRSDAHRQSATGMSLPRAVTLLPTPAVADARNTRNATAGRSAGQEHHHAGWTLSDVAHASRWGVYAQAIERWEHVFGRPAPEPTQPGAKGSPQLAPPFVEWMQGLPAGWVCDVPDLARNQKLSLLGDGVVPQQGAYAFAFLLKHLAGRLAVAA